MEAGQELVIKQYVKRPPYPERVPTSAAQFLLRHTTSVTALSSVFRLSPTSRGSELSIWGRACTGWGCSLLKWSSLALFSSPFGCPLYIGLSIPPKYTLWPQVVQHLEEVRHSVPSSEHTPGVIHCTQARGLADGTQAAASIQPPPA